MKEKIIAWLRDYFKAQGGPMAVVGISGGTDSSVTAALLAEALGPEKVMGVLMPCGVQHDLDVALALVRHLGIPYRVVNIEAPVRALSGIVGSAMGFDPEETKRQIQEGKKDSTGLFNLIFRLENMMQASVDIRSEPDRGTRVLIRGRKTY